MNIKQQPITTSDEGTSAVSAQRSSGLWRTVALVSGDLIVFIVFAAIGRRSHGEASGFGAIVETVQTAIPFAVGWFLVAPFMGAYKQGLELRPRQMALRTLLAWLAAWPVAMALRFFFVDNLINHAFSWRNVPTFSLITLITNTILLQIWRWPFSFIASRRR